MWSWLLLGLITSLYCSSCCGTSTTASSVFYVGFFNNWKGGSPSLLLMTTDTQPVLYTVEAPGIGYHLSGTVTAGAEAVIYFTDEIEMSITRNGNKGIYVTTNSSEVTLIGQNTPGDPLSSTGSFLVLPFIGSCDNEYVYYRMSVSSNNLNSIILLVGIENGTRVTVQPSQEVRLSAENINTYILGGTEFSFNLDRLKTALIGSNSNGKLTVVTNKPVSAFSGHECALIPDDSVAGCDYLIEQITPTFLWGRVHYIAPLATRRSYTIKIVAACNSTVVDIYCNNTKESNTIDDGVVLKRTYSHQELCTIYSSKEVFVAQFSHGQADDNVNGDPMMVTVPATIHYTGKFLFSTIRLADYAHYVNIIVLARYYQPDMIYMMAGGVNISLETQEWEPVEVNNVTEAYTTAVNVSEGIVEIIHADRSALMTAIVYGFARFSGYGHPGGFYLKNLHPATVSPPSMSLSTAYPQIVGQPQRLDCTAVVPECVAASVQFVWSSDGVELRRIQGTSFCFRYVNSSVCTDMYNISLLSTSDEGRVYNCDIIINSSPPVTATTSITLNLQVPTPVLTKWANGPIETTKVGFTQRIGCIANTVRGVEISAVKFTWTGPTGDNITNTSRLTVFPPYEVLGNDYHGDILFAYLREGDEGVYTCTLAILDSRQSTSFNLDPLPIQRPRVTIVPLGSQTAGQPLSLACYVETSRGIVSSLDITWSINGTVLSRTIGAVGMNLLYTTHHNISLLTTDDDGMVYRCDVLINSSPPVRHYDTHGLNVDVAQIPLNISQSIDYPVSGQLYNLTCRAASRGVSPSLVMLQWTKYDSGTFEYVAIPESTRVALSDLMTDEQQQVTKTLTFSPIIRSDTREYLCSVIVFGYPDGYNSQNINIGTNAPTVTVKTSPSMYTGNSGEDAVELTCTVVVMEVILEALYQFMWRKDGNLIDPSNNRLQITSSDMSSSLYIDSSDTYGLLDNGMYSCDVRVTIAGVDNYEYSSDQSADPSSVSLRVHSNLRAVNISSSTVILRWDAPVLGVVSQYNLTCASTEHNSTVIIPSTHTTGTIRGLTPFTSYNCSIVIYARSITVGIMSYPITVRTSEAASSPPVVTSVDAVDAHSVHVDWLIPNRVNGILSYYTIAYVTENGMEMKINIAFNGKPTQSYNITGLSHPYQQVTVTVSATNRGGTSRSSNTVSGRTAEGVPGVVQIYNVTRLADGTSATIVWYQPVQPNGVITGYQLIYSMYNNSIETMTSGKVSSAARKLTIRNLTPGVPYQGQVVAFTTVGRGELNDYMLFFSKELNPTKPPDNVTVVRLSRTSINVTWIPLSLFEARGFPRYNIVLLVDENNPITMTNTANSFVVINNLQVNTDYSVTVGVTTNGSTSPLQSSLIIVPKSDGGGGGGQSINGAVIGGVVAGVLFIVIVIVSLLLCYRLRRKGSFQLSTNFQMKHNSSSSSKHTSSNEKNGTLLDRMDEEL